MRTARYKAVLFDFDGTLADSSEGIYESLIYAFRADGAKIPTEAELRPFIGPPLYDSFVELFHYSDERAGWMIDKYREHYNAAGWKKLKIYDGIPELLQLLKANGVRLGVASSKPQAFVQRILEEVRLSPYFDCIGGATFDKVTLTKAQIMENSMNALGGTPKNTLMVGDRKFDILGAKELHMPCAAVLYGFGSLEEFKAYAADFIADSPKALETIIFKD